MLQPDAALARQYSASEANGPSMARGVTID